MQAGEQPDSDLDSALGVPIADVARILGVPMPTLRSWELRYGLPAMTRTRGQHRRYSQLEIHTIRLMRDEIARGQRASIAAQSVRSMLGVAGPATDLTRAVLAASEQLDPAAIRGVLDDACTTLGLAGCIDDVLLPSLRQVGIWWAEGHCDVDQERLTTEAVRGWLDRRSAFAPPPRHRRPILLACGPSDLHTVGLESLAVLLRYEGWPCRVLGAHISTVALLTAAQATGAAAVVIASHLATGRRRAVLSINAVHQQSIEVFYAGNAFSAPQNRKNVAGTYLGTRIREASQEVLRIMAAVD